jgi:2'-5' RNA ligase
MHGLVTLLPDPYYAKVESLWDELEARFGLSGIRITPYPHFSWNIAETYDRPQMDWAVAETALVTPVLKVQTDGIGLFPAPVPVLFIQVARGPQLDLLHRRLWDRMQSLGREMSAYYNPENWLPHISLAYGDLRSEQVPEVRAWLEAQESFQWEMEINNICYIHEPDGQVGELHLNVPLQRPEDV